MSKRDRDQEERLKNFILFKVWATDKEMNEIAPIILKGILIAFVIIGVGVILSI